jgi:hypothetical protein
LFAICQGKRITSMHNFWMGIRQGIMSLYSSTTQAQAYVLKRLVNILLLMVIVVVFHVALVFPLEVHT